MKNFLRQAFYLFFYKIIKFPVFSIAWIRKKVKGFPKIHGKKFKIGGKFRHILEPGIHFLPETAEHLRLSRFFDQKNRLFKVSALSFKTFRKIFLCTSAGSLIFLFTGP